MRAASAYFPTLLGLVLLLGATPRTAAAQAIGAPTRPTGGLFGENRSGDLSGNGLTMTFNAGGGGDRNVDPVDEEGNPLPGAASGSLATVDTTLHFRRGSMVRFFEANGLGYVQTASVAQSTVYGGEGTMRFSTRLSGRNGLTGSAQTAYTPAMLFNAFGGPGGFTGAGGIGMPGASTPQGILEQQWRSTDGALGFYRNWTSRQRMDLGYSWGRRTQVSGGPRLDNVVNQASFTHAWNARQNLGLDLSYGFIDNDQANQEGVSQVVRTHTASTSLRLTRPLGPNRQLALTLTGGANRATSLFTDVEQTFWSPVAAVALRWEPARTLALAADARRDVTILEGISPEPFVNNSFSFNTQYTPARRLQTAVTVLYSEGEAQLTQTGSFTSLNGIAQMQVAVARWCAWYASFSVYRYDLLDVSLVQPGFPSRYTLYSVRSGVTLWAPLAGRF